MSQSVDGSNSGPRVDSGAPARPAGAEAAAPDAWEDGATFEAHTALLEAHAALLQAHAARVREARVRLGGGLPALGKESGELGGVPPTPPAVLPPQAISVDTRPRSFPLTPAQHRIWLHAQLGDDASRAYNEQCVIGVRGRVDPDVLRAAIADVVAHHQSLRTAFDPSGRVQHVAPQLAGPLPLVIHDADTVGPPGRVAAAMDDAARAVFDLENGPLFRVHLHALGPERQALQIVTHHLVADGLAIGLVERDLEIAYRARREGHAPRLPAAMQMGEYLALLAAHAERHAGDAAEWLPRRQGAVPPAIPADRPRPPFPTHRAGEARRTLAPPLASRLRAFGREQGCTPFMTLLAGVLATLHRVCGQDDLVIGIPAAGRPFPGSETLVAHCVDVLPLSSRLAGSATTAEFVASVRGRLLEAYRHELSVSTLTAGNGDAEPAARPPVNVVFNLEPGGGDAIPATFAGIPRERVAGPPAPFAKFDLQIDAVDTARGIELVAIYAAELFDGGTVDRLLGQVERALEQIAAEPDAPVAALDLVDEAERRLLREEWRAPSARGAPNACVHALFEAHAARTPDAIAVVFGDEALTYAAVDVRANRLAHHLARRGAGPEARVGICMGPGLERVVALAGVLKAGGACVPLDPAYPAERLAHMVADSGAAVVLADLAGLAALPALPGVSVIAAGEAETGGDTHRSTGPKAEPGPESLAYVLYTSGSTGTPKGVAIPHLAVVRTVHATDYAPVFPPDRVGQGANLSFDAAIFEVWSALGNGATLVVLPREAVLSPERLAREIRAARIDTLFLPTAVFHQVARERPDALRPLKTVIFGGEAADPESLRQVLARGGDVRLVNGYGPTENTTFSTWQRVTEVPADARSVPIGRALARSWAAVLDGGMRPVPSGAVGELFVGGDGVARGYLGWPAATAERFVPDPFSPVPGARMYRTGDQARRRADGELEFLGRLDGQVKVRGVRIEAGEVEAALRRHPQVAQCAVASRPAGPGGARLVAWVVGTADAGELRRHLRRSLPEAFVPSDFVAVGHLPLTPNGKVDRDALPSPDEASRHTGGGAARTQVEEVLAGLWAEVLGRERVGTAESFFDLGGHSLLAARVASRVREALGVELALRHLFENPTVAALAETVESLRRDGLPPLPAIVPAERAEAPAASFAQERLWFLDRLEPGSAMYNVPVALRLAGALDPRAMERALGEIVRRHEALRTTLGERAGAPVQVIAPFAGFTLPVRDLSRLGDDARRAEARRIAAEDAGRPFDLAAGPLFRARLLRLGAEEHVLLLCMHHAVTDGWSLGVFFRELAAAYAAFRGGREVALAPLPVQYADYAVWQRRQLGGEALVRQLAYWKARLVDAPPLLDLPTDRPRPAAQTYRGAREPVALSPALADGVRALARREGATEYMVLLAAFQVLLGRWGATDDVVVGSPVAGRTRREVEGLIGFFANTVALRTDLSGGPGFREVLGRVREGVLAVFDHQDVPFERVVEEVRPERSLSHAPLFQAMFTLETAGAAAIDLPDVRAEGFDPGGDAAAKFDLTLALWTHAGGIRGALTYAADLFDAASARRMVAQLERVLERAATAPEASVARLSLLCAAERHRVVEAWNRTADTALASAPCIHRQIEAQAARRPFAPAVTDGAVTLTYAELDERAASLARQLRGLGVGPEARVAVCLERGAELIVALLGVIKAGGAFVALDPAHPAARLEAMLADSGAMALVTREALRGRFAERPEVRVIRVDRDVDRGAAAAAETPQSGASARTLAYVVYTSGSTGTPRGVAVEHASLANLCGWHAAACGISPADCAAQLVSPGFDASLLETWPVLARGGRVHVVPEAVRADPVALRDWLVAERVTLATAPAAIAGPLQELEWPEGTALRWLVSGGERLRTRPPERLPFRVANQYGPAECTVTATAAVVACGGAREPSIGAPIGNVRVYVLDEGGEPAPIGIPGELYVGGAGVARGYPGRPALTAERFLPDPFGAAGGRVYRTGDRARWRDDGTLEFLGRRDEQVKIRGVRVEPAEVGVALRRHPEVAEACVVAHEDASGERRLAAYVAGRRGGVDAEALRTHLRRLLPEPFIPGAFVLLGRLPLTPNGKVDRAALPPPEPPAADGDGAAPRTLAEGLLAGIWAELLGRERVGIDANFFALGGHSLLAARVVSRVREALGVELPLRALFEASTVRALAERVGALRGGGAPGLPPVIPVPRTGPLPLSFGQERLWFLDRLKGGSPFYQISEAIRYAGPLDVPALERALGEIVRRHEALRTTFHAVDGAPVARVAPFAGFTLPVEDVSERGEAEAVRRAGEDAALPFDLAVGPLFRASLLRLGAHDHLLLLAMHHAVSDGWSMEILFREVAAMYGGCVEGRPWPLAELPVQYADFAAWQRAQAGGERLERQRAYWTARLAGAPALLALPADRPRPAVQSYRGARLAVRLPAALSERARVLGRREGATPYMVLLAAFQVLLGRYARSDDVLVGSPVAGRGRREVEGLIGFFANTLVMRAQLSGDPSFRAVLRRVREATLEAYEHQDLPFEKLVAELRPERSLAHAPLFQVMFSLAAGGAVDGALPGLRASSLAADAGTAQFDLTLVLDDTPRGFTGVLEYSTDLFERATAERMMAHLERVLEGAVADPDRPIARLELAGAAERARLLAWGRGSAGAPVSGGVAARFEARAARHPQAVALTCGAQAWSYGELNARANRLARRLRALGVGPEARVGVCAGRSPELVAGILAVLKAGGAYVPLDPAYPPERLAWMAEDAAIRVLVTHPAVLDRAAAVAGVEVVCLDAGLEQESAENLGLAADAGQLAYLLYTSGSTGQPKGVGVTHGNVLRLFAATEPLFGFGGDDVWTLFHSFAFDFSVWEMFGALLHGGRLVIVPREVARDPAGFRALLARERVTVLSQTPPAFRALAAADEVEGGGAELALRLVIFGGEALDAASPAGWIARRGDRRPVLVNMYGITETTVHVTQRALRREDVGSGAAPPIGASLAGWRAYVTDGAGNPSPLGVPGELCVGGAGVARGYPGRPALTAERFVPDPFSGEPGARLYRSGDLARWRADGALEYLGRIDRQVKIRGFRIEPGEVQAVLAAHPAVREVVVADYEAAPGDRRLAAYVTRAAAGTAETAGDADEFARDLLRFARERLPEHMVPAAIVPVARIPLTANGKLDRAALPAPAEGTAARASFAAPREGLEARLAALWGEVLGVERVGRDDGFFDLGGHSLLLARLHARLGEVVERDVPIVDLFRFPTVAALAAHLGAAADGGGAAPQAEGRSRAALRQSLAANRHGPTARDTGA